MSTPAGERTEDQVQAWSAARPGPELTIVVPTFNERGNVETLVDRLRTVLAGVEWQLIFVDDDSPDGTAEAVKAIAAEDVRIQCLRRVSRRGLAGAVIEGALASSAPFVAVMDGDLQHDEALLPLMLGILREGRTDVVVGSRYVGGASAVIVGLDGRRRQWGSRLAVWLGRRALSVELSDPMSGFFMLRRELVDGVAKRLSTDGFKVLLDIVASQDTPPRCLELPYEFRARTAGVSKLDSGVVAQYLGLIASKLSHDLISPRMLMFGLVGASGVAIHLTLLKTLLGLNAAFALAQFGGAAGAMTSNYLINNAVTYRDRRKRGWRLLTGYLRFCLLCSMGLAANVAVADVMHQTAVAWWFAGASGAVVGAAWNYLTTSIAVW
ncbi:glycosyltransferase family 2 protein [Phenylobacterium sp.]|uniref:glycosyltransferase family 2 protein n=1 Tax=Phenylobacterium sp. TaxID=1871053 RepID=UPI0035ADD4E1